MRKYRFRRVPRQTYPYNFCLGEQELNFKETPKKLAKSETTFEGRIIKLREIWWVDRLLLVEISPEIIILSNPRSSQYNLSKETISKYGAIIMEWLGLKGLTFSDFYIPNMTTDFLIQGEDDKSLIVFDPVEMEEYI